MIVVDQHAQPRPYIRRQFGIQVGQRQLHAGDAVLAEDGSSPAQGIQTTDARVGARFGGTQFDAGVSVLGNQKQRNEHRQ
ncbi:hypothetical protein BGC_01010 [Burkholderia sp. 3C]